MNRIMIIMTEKVGLIACLDDVHLAVLSVREENLVKKQSASYRDER